MKFFALIALMALSGPAWAQTGLGPDYAVAKSLADQDDFGDGLSDGERLTALNAAFPDCFRVVLKPEGQTEAEFLALPREVYDSAEKRGVDLRTAALMLGIGRIAEAKRRRGVFP